MIEFVELAAAREARGIRMAVSGRVPSPWSEAAKGLFRVIGVPVLAVRATVQDAEFQAWAKADNVPVVMNDDEPPRTNWSAILALACRLAPGKLAPEDPRGRATVFGLVHELAGEDGLGWCARLLMIDAGL